MTWTPTAVSLVVLVISSVDGRTRQFPSPVDGGNCDSRSISSVVPAWEVSGFKRKLFSGCTIRSGELVAITNRLSVPLNIVCRNEDKKPDFAATGNQVSTTSVTEELKGSLIPPNYSFVMNVYVNVENMVGPRWTCLLTRSDPSYNEVINFTAFSDYKKRESFHYEVTSSGLYESDPRLVKRWRMTA